MLPSCKMCGEEMEAAGPHGWLCGNCGWSLSQDQLLSDLHKRVAETATMLRKATLDVLIELVKREHAYTGADARRLGIKEVGRGREGRKPSKKKSRKKARS